jgi:hypothetical protein
MTPATSILRFRLGRLIRVSGVVLAVVVALAGCAGSGDRGGAPAGIVARVDGRAITGATVEHWMAVLAPRHVVPDRPSKRQALTSQALGFLISANWLIGEAAERGLGVSGQEVKQRLEQQIGSYPGGAAEFEQSLKAIGHTLGDSELEITAELASEKLRRSIAKAQPTITEADLAAYYRRNISRYLVSERRYFNLVQTVRPEPGAKRHLEAAIRGKSLAEIGRHEMLERSEVVHYKGGDTNILAAIVAARPHVVVGPLEQDAHFFVFEVARIVPAHPEPFAKVRRSIARELADARQRRALGRFADAWRTRWVARTDCEPGYVVQKCRQYNGAPAPEDPFKLE